MDRLRERPSLHGELSSPHAPLVHIERVGMHSPPFLNFLTKLIKMILRQTNVGDYYRELQEG
jgi:hypothetical protein